MRQMHRRMHPINFISAQPQFYTEITRKVINWLEIFRFKCQFEGNALAFGHPNKLPRLPFSYNTFPPELR